MRVCIVGAGAIGGFLGAKLAAAGVETSALARGSTLGALRAHGWRLRCDSGEELTCPVRASDDPCELGVHDVVVLAVKAHSLPTVAASVGPLLGPETVVLTAVNGVPWWFFQRFGGPCEDRRIRSVDPDGSVDAAIPADQVVGGVLHTSCSVVEPGLVRQHGGSGLIIGEPDRSESRRVDELAALLRSAGLECTVSTAIHRDVWYKLWGNLTMNPVSALTGATTDQMLDDELVRAFCERVMAEAQEIGRRIGCPISETPADRTEVTRALGGFTTSMLQDREAGRSLELDALVGAVREIATVVGVPIPNIDALFGLTRLAAGTRGLY